MERVLLMLERPQLSVIIASYNSGSLIESCLESLKNQNTDQPFEIIVIDSSSDGMATLIRKRFPEVRLYQFPERKFCGDARNFGLSVAKGEIIAFIDADCRAASNWVDQILSTHQSPSLAIGGAIANANPDNYVGWAAYFTEFSHWMPGTPHKWLDDIPGANLTYKREVFDKYGSYLEGTYCSDTDFHWRIGRDGHRLRFVPSILVSHHNTDNLKHFLQHAFHHGQSFARVRIRGQNFSPLKRVIYVVCALFIPLRIFFKVAFNNMKNRVYLFHFITSLPLLVLGIVCWSMGEVVGYAGGWRSTARTATSTQTGII